MSHPKFAIIEMNSQNDIYANLCAIEQAVQAAKQCGAKLVVLPENAFCFGEHHKVGKFFQHLFDICAKIAKNYQIHLLAGTLPCPWRDDGSLVADGKLRQVSLLFDDLGQCLARYDKIHLFKALVNDKTGSYDEGRIFEAGHLPVVAKMSFGNIGLMICFDLRFPTLALTLRQMGADILVAPSAFTYQTGKAHWQSLLTARALDSQCFIIAAGQCGHHQFIQNGHVVDRQTWGHSQFVNANGELVGELVTIDQFMDDLPCIKTAQSWLSQTQMSKIPKWQLIMAEFDNAYQQTIRNNMPLMACQHLAFEP